MPLNEIPATPEPVLWFRGFAPYLNAHRGKTFVVYFGGEAVEDPSFPDLLHDLALLNSLGIRLVLVHGIRPQIDARLERLGQAATYQRGLRVTDAAALSCVKEAAGTVRVEIEALLSMGLPNSPMAGTRIRVASGNFVIARPVGVRDGVDFEQTGEVRRIDTEGVGAALNLGDIVLLSAVGYSSTGEIFNLRSEDVATAAATALKADKLILFGEEDFLDGPDGEWVRQLTTEEAARRLHKGSGFPPALRVDLEAAVKACREGVGRVHYLNWKRPGALLLELFTRDGVGTLVSQAPFERLRAADVGDIPGIRKLLSPLEETGVLVRRTQERLESAITDYSVIDRDGTILGCAALHFYEEDGMAEVACLALHPDYRGVQRGQWLLEHLEKEAKAHGVRKVFVLTTQTEHWFREHGYEPATLKGLPSARQADYDPARNSKILIKGL
jgi:amino-acid N-acetyltransferase